MVTARQRFRWAGLSLVCVALVCGMAQSAVAEQVTNGGFELPPVAGIFENRGAGNTLAGWTVVNNVDHIGTFWQPAEGTQSLDLHGNVAGSVFQDLATGAGQNFVIRFFLAGNPFGFDNKRLQVLWEDVQVADLTFLQAGNTDVDMGYVFEEIAVQSTGPTSRLEFRSLTGAMNGSQGFTTFYGPVIDGVSVTAVPEPASVLSWMIAAVCLGFSTLRRCLTR